MKNNISNYLSIFILFIISACSSESGEKNHLQFNNNFEQTKGWTEYKKLSEKVSHSGLYSCLIDSSDQYSYVFKLKFNEISKNKIKKVKYTVWCYTDDLPAKGNIVVTVRNDTTENILWNGAALQNFITEKGKWIEIKTEVNLEKVNVPQNQIGIFAWNVGNSKIYVDDLNIEFEE